MPLPTLYACLRLLRPNQAYKLVIIWLPALFHGGTSIQDSAPLLWRITVVWFLASGIVYIVNDMFDRREDATRPHAQRRPLASGEVTFRNAATFLALMLLAFGALFFTLSARLQGYLLLYLGINAAYCLFLKEQIGVRQLCIAVGFWLRLKSGASPVVGIPLTLWASMFTLSMAYHLSCLKGLAGSKHPGDSSRSIQLSSAILAGSLALVALTSLCIKRGMDGTLLLPEFPPMLCLLAMHRSVQRSLTAPADHDQSRILLRDPIILGSIALFAVLFLLGTP